MGLASRGLRDLDGGIERVDNAGERAALRGQARGVWVRSLVATFLVMAATLLLP